MKMTIYAVATFLFLSTGQGMAQGTPMALGGHGGERSPKGGMKHKMMMGMASEGIFEGPGEVMVLVPEKSQIMVDHEEIPGFMAAMIMGYPVRPAKLLQGLRRGDRIRFTIDSGEKAIVKIIRLEK